ncbi:unnamed protein product [Lactuca virosa]|uniref:Uncharacterized protein n=1 Tax=Lactuca virosa TaxID=75947 RepID=A0AAU9P2A2_9ASTR|nr:unnamed protein product [Lactuca virosa]
MYSQTSHCPSKSLQLFPFRAALIFDVLRAGGGERPRWRYWRQQQRRLLQQHCNMNTDGLIYFSGVSIDWLYPIQVKAVSGFQYSCRRLNPTITDPHSYYLSDYHRLKARVLNQQQEPYISTQTIYKIGFTFGICNYPHLQKGK